MDDPRQPPEASGLPLPGPHSEQFAKTTAGGPFVPMRLVLRPGGTPVEMTRPDMLIGRHSDCDIRLSLPDVSRRHCRFVFAGGRWQIFDLHSLNGIYVNGNRVLQATLNHGDLIRLGGLTFEVQCHQVPTPRVEVDPAPEMVTRSNILRTITNRLPMPGQEPPQRKAS